MKRSIRSPIRQLAIATIFIPLLQLGSFAAEWETPKAITNLTIVPSPGRSIENGTILIDRGRIGGGEAFPSQAHDWFRGDDGLEPIDPQNPGISLGGLDMRAAG